ncbi:MAG: hypothetical protein WBD31_05460 [Rubripirellula sp.]
MSAFLTFAAIALVICGICTLVVVALIRRAPLIESPCEDGSYARGFDGESSSARPAQRRLQLQNENRSPVVFVPAMSPATGGQLTEEADTYGERSSAWNQPIPR